MPLDERKLAAQGSAVISIIALIVHSKHKGYQQQCTHLVVMPSLETVEKQSRKTLASFEVDRQIGDDLKK